MRRIREYFKAMLEELFLDSENRICVQLRLFCIAASVIAIIMTLLNCFKGEAVLGMETAVGAVVSVLIYFYVSRTRNYLPGSLCIVLIFLGLLTLFVAGGMVEGFAALWFCLYPFICLFVLDIKAAVAFSITGFVILSAFLWTPLQELLPPVYTPNFLLRFPFLYVGNFAFALALNGFYSYTYKRLLQMNQVFERLSNQDGLTKLANRNYLELYKQKLFRDGEIKLSALMLDVDFFKQYNDTYGHLAGDEVLKAIARQAMELTSRENALAVRYGGEEFLILLPGAGGREAEAFAQKLLENVRSLNIPHTKGKGFVSVSIGISSRDGVTEKNFTELVGQADNALYCAKQNGRDGLWAGPSGPEQEQEKK